MLSLSVLMHLITVTIDGFVSERKGGNAKIVASAMDDAKKLFHTATEAYKRIENRAETRGHLHISGSYVEKLLHLSALAQRYPFPESESWHNSFIGVKKSRLTH